MDRLFIKKPPSFIQIHRHQRIPFDLFPLESFGCADFTSGESRRIQKRTGWTRPFSIVTVRGSCISSSIVGAVVRIKANRIVVSLRKLFIITLHFFIHRGDRTVALLQGFGRRLPSLVVSGFSGAASPAMAPRAPRRAFIRDCRTWMCTYIRRCTFIREGAINSPPSDLGTQNLSYLFLFTQDFWQLKLGFTLSNNLTTFGIFLSLSLVSSVWRRIDINTMDGKMVNETLANLKKVSSSCLHFLTQHACRWFSSGKKEDRWVVSMMGRQMHVSSVRPLPYLPSPHRALGEQKQGSREAIFPQQRCYFGSSQDPEWKTQVL